ncbi:zinc ribbon-containing protein [Enterococcus avium]
MWYFLSYKKRFYYSCGAIIILESEVNNCMAYTTGEKPGKGTYTCKNCGQKVRLDDRTDTLPPCPSCDKTTYTK